MTDVLSDADDSLAGWLATLVPAGTAVALFGPDPSEDTPRPRAETGAGTLLVHLHRVRESPDGSGAGWNELRSAEGAVVGRVPPTRRYRLTYLLTAVATDVRTEHDILGHVLSGSAATEVVPAAHLRGSLAVDAGGEPVAVLARCAPEESFVDPAVLWAAWRIAPRASLEMSLLVPMPQSYVGKVPDAPREIDLQSSRREPPPELATSGPRSMPRRRAQVSED